MASTNQKDHPLSGAWGHFMLPLAVLNFLIWIFLWADGFYFAQDINHADNSLIGANLNSTVLYFAPILFLSVPLVYYLDKHLLPILAIASIGIWLLFLLFQSTLLLPFPDASIISPQIWRGYFKIYHPWILIIMGYIAILLFSAVLKDRLEQAAILGQSLVVDYLITAVGCILFCLAHEYLISWQLDVVMGISLSLGVVILSLNVKNESETRTLPGHRSIVVGVFSFIFVLGLTYIAMHVGLAPFTYYALDLGIILLSLGAIIAIGVLVYLNQVKKLSIPWWWLLIGPLLVGLVLYTILLSTLNFSDSSYITNPPPYYAPVLAGVMLGIMAYGINLAYLQFETLDPADHPRVHRVARFWLSFGFVFMLFYGMTDGMRADTNGDGYWDTLLIGIGASILLVVITFAIVRIGRSRGWLRLHMGREVLITESTIQRGRYQSPARKPVLVTGLILLVCGASMAIIPPLLPPSPDSSGYPSYLGRLSTGCVVSEVSPLTKIGKFKLLNAPLGEEPGAVISRSMAKNEFESIQVVFSNWGGTPISIQSVKISESAYGGLPSAFTDPPVEKTWKGEAWEWPRFTAQHVADIQENYPNILYELKGNQTRYQSVYGLDEPRPKPIVKPGQNLALWFTIYAGSDLESGMHSDAIQIQTDKGTFEITLVTKIWDFELPTSHSMRTAIGNRRVYFLETRDEWSKNFLQHRISPYFPFNHAAPYYKKEGTTITFNLTQWEIDLDNAIANGLDSFRITYKPASIKEGCFTADFNATTLSYYSQLGQFLESHLLPDGRTWLDLAIVYAMDEPTEEEYEIFDTWSTLVHQANPGWRVLLTEQVETPIENYVDIWVPHINSINTSNILPQQAKGKEFWYYTCCSLANKPTVSFVDPAVDNRALFWTAWAFNLQGFLFWDANAYVLQDVNDPYYLGYDAIGDAIMLLQDANQMPINTIVWESMRDGLEDVEYFAQLENLNAQAPALQKIQEKWAHWVNFPRDYGAYLDLRETVGELISNA